MITAIDDSRQFISEIEKISDNDPFACRVISLCQSYPPGLAFVEYWLVLEEDGKACTGAIARSGTSFVLFLTKDTDIDEVSSFMRVAGAYDIICSGDYTLDVSYPICNGGVILYKDKKSAETDDYKGVITPDIKDTYELIMRCSGENFEPPSFDDFYVDVNHKLRHNTMRLYGIQHDGALVAAAMTVAESGTGAVLGAVACDPDYRRQGFGSKIVSCISDKLISEGKTVFLHRAENENTAFYDNLGFKLKGKWKEYKFKG